jgi:ribosomal protein S18 acetylase RimI-like enzyme
MAPVSDERDSGVGITEARPVLAPVGSADLAVLEALVRAYYAEDGLTFDERRQPAGLARLVEGDAFAAAWLVRQDGGAIGYVILTWSFSLESGGRDGFIDELFLVPEVRGRGLGTQVLAQAELEARRRGCLRLYLEVEHGNPAIGLYRRAGFVDHRRHLLSKRLAP